MSTIQDAMLFTQKEEGGWTPIDGGTMYGVTQAVYDDYRRKEGMHLQNVRLIEDGEVRAIMEDEYWYPGHCNEMPSRLAIAHFDWIFNHGVSGAIHSLQTVLGVVSDGVFGPVTLHAMQAAIQEDPNGLIQKYLDARREWYREYVVTVPEKAVYLNGWLNRVDALETYLQGIAA